MQVTVALFYTKSSLENILNNVMKYVCMYENEHFSSTNIVR